MPDHYAVYEMPALHQPVLIAAFKGWNDAAEGATSAIRFLIDAWSPHRVASLDPEEFYDFTQTRPRVRLIDGLHRQIDWPVMEMYAHSDEAGGRDMVLLVGDEPQLRWRTFVEATIGVTSRLGVSSAVMLGALLADVPHTRPTRITGSTPDQPLYKRLADMGVGFSRYEGPTGMVGVLQDTFNRNGIPAASLWGNVPHYISASPNPSVSSALLRSVEQFLGLDLDLTLLDGQARSFRARVDEAIARSPEAMAYVKELESHEQTDDDMPSSISPSQLPTGPEVVRALEEFLRHQRAEEDE